MTRKVLGRFVVIDPGIGHGQPTFVGTRIFVSDVLDMVAEGMAWEDISRQWRDVLPPEAIAEAIALANRAFVVQAQAHAVELVQS